MASRAICFRIPETMFDRIRSLRGFVSVNADVPRALVDVTITDVAQRAIALGLDIMENERKLALSRGEFREPTAP